jgi:hypothetical protein
MPAGGLSAQLTAPRASRPKNLLKPLKRRRFRESERILLESPRHKTGAAQPARRLMKSIPATRADLRRLTAAEFARMSKSLQLTLLVIRRAQIASRKVLAATPDWERYRADEDRRDERPDVQARLGDR